MNRHYTGLQINIQNAFSDHRKKYFLARGALHHIDIVRTGLQHILQLAKRLSLIGHHLKNDQICNIILVFLQRNCILAGNHQITAFVHLYIIDIVQIATGKLGPADGSGYEDDTKAAQPQKSSYDELANLAKLHKEGVLTDEEFARMKAECLAK